MIIFGFLWRFKTEDICIFDKSDWGYIISEEWEYTDNFNLRQTKIIQYYKHPVDWFKGNVTETMRHKNRIGI